MTIASNVRQLVCNQIFWSYQYTSPVPYQYDILLEKYRT